MADSVDIRLQVLGCYGSAGEQSPDWEQPTADEVRALLTYAELTGSKAGALIGVNGRTIRKYTGGERAIPFAAWVLLCAYAGLVQIPRQP